LVEKLNFVIDNMELIEENPNSHFSILSLDFFASGKNLHNMIVSESTLMKNAGSIKNCPVVWKYSSIMDDATSHEKDETAVGFVPEKAEIKSKKLDDGRTMISTIAYVWKNFSGRLLDIFERDGDKPVSVEMSVFKTEERPDGLTELLDYAFEAITILGSLVKPAIPLATATILQFSQEYEEDYQKEFGTFSTRYDSLDTTIPQEVKENTNRGLKLYKEHNKGGNAIILATAHHISKNDKASFEKIRHMAKVHKSNKFVGMKKSPPSDSYISFLLYGGEAGNRWSIDLNDKLEQLDKQHVSYFEETVTFPYSKIEDINPSLKGVTPALTLGQANEIAKVADSIGADKNGWPIAISQFKKTHKIVEGKWVKKEKMSEDETIVIEDEVTQSKMSAESENDKGKENKNNVMEDEEKKDQVEEMAVDEKDKEKEETPEEEKKESPEEEQKEEEDKTEGKGKEENMSLDGNLDCLAIVAFLQNETDQYQEMVDEFNKPEEQRNYAVVAKGMWAKMSAMAAEKTEMCNRMSVYEAEKAEMSTKMAKFEEENKTYMAENEELKKFKSEQEEAQKKFAVDRVLKEIETKVEINPKALEDMRERSLEFSYTNLGIWENECKAKALDFAIKAKDGTRKIGLPWPDGKQKGDETFWDRLGK
jgi:hypothetical protein